MRSFLLAEVVSSSSVVDLMVFDLIDVAVDVLVGNVDGLRGAHILERLREEVKVLAVLVRAHDSRCRQN